MHKIVNIGVVTFCTLTFAHVASAQSVAADQQPAKIIEEELDEVTVTASRMELPVAQTPKPVIVITRKQIEQSPARSIGELLAYSANVDILQRGGRGVQTDVSIRGGSFDQTAILINGINFSNPQTGHYSLDLPVNLSDIERIEIVQGPSALIYGASAFSGGINIITKDSIAERIIADVSAGMYNLKEIEVRGAAKSGIATHSLSVGYKASDGFTGATNTDKYGITILGGYVDTAMSYAGNTAYDMYNLLWQSNLEWRSGAKLSLLFGYNNKRYGANSFYTPAWPDQYERTGSFNYAVRGSFGDRLKFIPTLYWNRHLDRFDLIKDVPWERNFHRGDTYGATMVVQYTSPLGVTGVVGELRREDILSSKLGKRLNRPQGNYLAYDERLNTSVTLEHTLRLSRWLFSAGVLMNHNTFRNGEYGFYPSLSASYRPVDAIKIAASWSRSTRMPTYTELYYNTATHQANENLLPERSESLDLSLRYRNSRIEVGITGFMLWGRDMIDWIKVNADDKPTSSNITKVDTRGIDASLRLLLGNQTSLSVAYTRMSQQYDAGETISESAAAINYLRDKLTVGFNHPVVGALTANWQLRFQKRMGTYEVYDNYVATGRYADYPAFATLDLRLDYRVGGLLFHLNATNLTDTKYCDWGNVPTPRFWLMGGVGYSF